MKSKLWWENLPQCKVGDLVRYKSNRRPARESDKTYLVVEVYPVKPSRAHCVQSVTVLDSLTGKTKVFEAGRLEALS